MRTISTKTALSIAVAATLYGAQAAVATPVSVVSIATESQAGFNALNGTGSKVGSPGIAGFPDGPFTVNSGVASDLTTSNQINGQDSILLVLTDLSPLAGNQSITLSFDDTLSNKTTKITLNSANFFTTAQAGFNSGHFDNGKVNGISFIANGALHAGVDITYSGPLPAKTLVASVSVSTPIALRLDIFGDKQGLIMSRSANSLAEGIYGGSGGGGGGGSVPEPSTLFVMGAGLSGLIFARSRKRRAAAPRRL